MAQGVKGTAVWAKVGCPTCGAPPFERCMLGPVRKASHPHLPRMELAALQPSTPPRQEPPGYEVEVDEEAKAVLVAFVDPLLPVPGDRVGKAALRAARKTFGDAVTVRLHERRPPIDWATARPRGVLFKVVPR